MFKRFHRGVVLVAVGLISLAGGNVACSPFEPDPFQAKGVADCPAPMDTYSDPRDEEGRKDPFCANPEEFCVLHSEESTGQSYKDVPCPDGSTVWYHIVEPRAEGDVAQYVWDCIADDPTTNPACNGGSGAGGSGGGGTGGMP